MPSDRPRYSGRSTSELSSGYGPKKKKSGGLLGNIVNRAVGGAARRVGGELTSLQYVPGNGNAGQTLGDIFGNRWGSGGGGGGGGYDPYAAQRAAEERQRAAMRAQYQAAIGQLGGQNNASYRALGDYYNQARGRANPIFAQNRALTGDYNKQLQALTRNASQGVLSQGDMLARDLQGQGAGLGDLRGVIGSDVTDILGAGAASQGFNNRLGQVMGRSEADNSAMLSAILQGAQSTRQTTYDQELAKLRMALAGLA